MIGRDKKAIFLLALWAVLFLLSPVRSLATTLTNFIPIFQFEVFYYDDNLDISPGPELDFNGPVHANKNIYLSPGLSTTFSNKVTAAGNIVLGPNPGNPAAPGNGPTTFLGTHTSGVAPWLLPADIGSNIFTGHAPLEVPPAGESPTSTTGRDRLFNQVDLSIIITNTISDTVVVTARSGYAVDHASTTISSNNWKGFLNLSNSFYNVREAATIKAVTFDVGKFKFWSLTNTALRPFLGFRDVSSVFIADLRPMAATNQSGLIITNGKFLPSDGLTIITPNPAYIVGDYNTTDDGTSFYPGTNDTSHTRPASVMCDAITILSAAWNPAYSSSNLFFRAAVNTTVNVAILAGNVTTTNGYYSGGVENFFRFMEDWQAPSRNFTFNGSIVQLFASRIATRPWLGTGSAYNVYNPPIRNWSFDKNFNDYRKYPPCTPSVEGGLVPPPTILANPQNTNITAGNTLILSVAATNDFIGYYSYFPLTNWWYFNTNTFLLASTNTTLTLTNVQLSQAGKYHVVVSNASGGTASAFATVTVFAKSNTVTTLGSLPWSPQLQLNLTAAVTAFSGNPTGQVEFKEGTNSLGTAPVIPPFATLSNISLTPGDHTITAYYSGDANYNPSTSAPALQRVGLFFQPPNAPSDGTLVLSGSGAPGQTCVLDQAGVIQSPMIWTPIATNTADSNGHFNFSQTISTNDLSHFYRLRLP